MSSMKPAEIKSVWMQPGTVAGNEAGISFRIILVGSFRHALCPSVTGSISHASARGESFKLQELFNSLTVLVLIVQSHPLRARYHLLQSRCRFVLLQR